MKRITMGLAALAAVVALAIVVGAWQGWIAEASPDEVYVNDNVLPDVEGCNSPDANTIADGILAADPGDTVVVCEGTYDGATVGKSVTIEGRAEANRADIVVEGASDGLVVTADGVTIRHMRFDGIDGTDVGILIQGNGATVQDVEAVDWDIGIVLDGSTGSVVEDSEVDDSSNAGILAADGGNNVIRRNVVGAGNSDGVVVEDDKIYIDRSHDLEKPIEALYTAYLEDDADKYPVGLDYAAGLHYFLSLENIEPLVVKGQVTGPVSWGLTVTDDSQRSIIYDDTLADAAAKLLRLKAAWQEKALNQIYRNVRPHARKNVDFS